MNELSSCCAHSVKLISRSFCAEWMRKRHQKCAPVDSARFLTEWFEEEFIGSTTSSLSRKKKNKIIDFLLAISPALLHCTHNTKNKYWHLHSATAVSSLQIPMYITSALRCNIKSYHLLFPLCFFFVSHRGKYRSAINRWPDRNQSHLLIVWATKAERYSGIIQSTMTAMAWVQLTPDACTRSKSVFLLYNCCKTVMQRWT